MRARIVLAMMALLVPTLASAGAVVDGSGDDAWRVVGDHPVYGSVTGYLQARQYALSEVWLSGPLLIYFHGTFSFACDQYGEDAAIVQLCSGPNGKHFAGAYTVDANGSATGPASGAGTMFGFTLVAYVHT